MQTDEEILGIAGGKFPAKRKGSDRTKSLGPLYDLLKGGLPQYVNNGSLMVKRIAPKLGISYQAMYGWFERNTVSPARIDDLVALSKEAEDKMYSDFKPLCRDDFWPFMGR